MGGGGGGGAPCSGDGGPGQEGQLSVDNICSGLMLQVCWQCLHWIGGGG